MKICIIVSNFYPKISAMLIEGAVSKFKKNKITIRQKKRNTNQVMITGVLFKESTKPPKLKRIR